MTFLRTIAGIWVTYKAKGQCWATLGNTASGLDVLRNKKDPQTQCPPPPSHHTDFIEYSWAGGKDAADGDSVGMGGFALPNEDPGTEEPGAPSGAERQARGRSVTHLPTMTLA